MQTVFDRLATQPDPPYLGQVHTELSPLLSDDQLSRLRTVPVFFFGPFKRRDMLIMEATGLQNAHGERGSWILAMLHYAATK